MRRRVSKTAIALFALTLVLQTPSAFAAAQRGPGHEPVFTRIVQKVRTVIKNLLPGLADEGVVLPKPPTG